MTIQRLYAPRQFSSPTATALAIVLDIAGAALLLCLSLAFAYEMIALLIRVSPGPANPPLITEIVRPWIAANRQWALLILALYVGFSTWLIFHFYTG